MLEHIGHLDKILTRCRAAADTQAERDFVDNARASLHDMQSTIQELDF